MPQKITVNNLQKPTRLDRVLRDNLPDVGRKAINQLIQDRQVKINNKKVWMNSWKVNNGDVITLASVPDAHPQQVQQFDDNWIIAQDKHLIVVNKPHGLLSHQTRYGNHPDLLTMARERFGKVTLFNRLDRDTSGVILLTKSKKINRYLDTAFKQHTVQKEYVALVKTPNQLQSSGVIKTRLKPNSQQDNRMMVTQKGGQSAVTAYSTGDIRTKGQLVYLQPKTGRTHQLRVHLAHMDAFILGDRLYSDTHDQYQRLYLHAHRLTLPLADDFPEQVFTAPIPDEFT